jgi:ElaB/YqjD/DUF883 family membrane-anchored ribosome-binding protein
MNTGIESFGQELRRLLENAEELLREGGDGAGEKLDAAGTQLREALHRAREHLRAAEQELGAGARRLDHTVRSHPWESLATVGIAAFLLGLLVRHR